jgi:arylsulfatase A-like enzyme
MKKLTLPFFAILLLVSCISATKISEKPVEKKPNILLIMADDLGFSDIGSYGSEIKTPNIDRLAAEGTRLRQCYNNGICAPSRASLLTGQYPHKAGIGFFNRDLGVPGYEGYLNSESLTLAEVLKTGGYETFMSGKWHVGNTPDKWPTKRGFDKFFGFIDGGISYWDTKPIMRAGPFASNLYLNDQEFKITKKDHYLTDELTDQAIGFLKESPKDKPFFMYMAYNAPHWPIHAKPTDIEKYKGMYDIGWDSLRTVRLNKLKALGLVDAQSNPMRDRSITPWNKLTFDEKAMWVKKMEVYAAMVDNLDQNIGKLLKYLEETNQIDNTLIVFISDNGAEDWDFSKMSLAINRDRGPVGTAGSNESYTQNWAQVSNVPLRSYKSTPYEGGVSSPFIARYPKIIPANSIQDGGLHLIDFMPSFLELSGIKYPTSYNGKPVNPMVGESFLSSLKNNNWERKEPLYYEWAGNRMARMGKWKTVSYYPQNKWQLFDLSTDRTENVDLADKFPEIVNQIDQNYHKWAAGNKVTEWNDTMVDATGFPLPKKAGIRNNH